MVKRYTMLKCMKCHREYIKPARIADGHICECGGKTLKIPTIPKLPPTTVKKPNGLFMCMGDSP